MKTILLPETYISEFNLNITQIIILNYLYNHNTGDPELIFNEYTCLISSDRVVRRASTPLVEHGLIHKRITTNPHADANIEYKLTKFGRQMFDETIPTYSLEEYLDAAQVIGHWNSLECTSIHRLAPYNQKQTKLVNQCIKMIIGFKSGRYPVNIKIAGELYKDHSPISTKKLLEVMDEYSKKFEKEYMPEDKTYLPIKLDEWFIHYKSKHSEMLNTLINGVKENNSAIDSLKGTSITPTILKKAYEVLSESGKATQQEKLQIQKALVKFYKRWEERKEELDEYYSPWNKNYKERFSNYNTFLYELLHYLESNVHNCKIGYISFRQGNKVMEAFSSYMVDKYNLYLWPSEKKKEELKKRSKNS